MSTSTKQAPATAAATNTTPAAEADTHKSSEATDNSKSKQNQQQRPPYKRAYNNNNNNSNSEHPHRHPRQGPRPPYSGPPPAVVARITASDEFKEYRELAPSEVTDEEIMRAMRNFRNDPEKVKMHLISLYEKDTQGNKTTVGGFRGGRKPRDPNDDWKMVGKPKKNAPTKPGASRTQGKQKGASQSGKNAQKTSKSHQEEEEEDDDDEDEDEDSDDDSDAADNNVDKTKNAAAAWNGKALIEKVKKEKESAAKLSAQQNPPLPKKTAPAGPASSQQPSYAKASAPKPNEAHDQGSAKTPNEQGNQNNQQQPAAQPEVPSSSQTTAPVEQKPPAQPVVKAPAKPNYADILKGKKEKQPADKKPVKPATGSAKENQVADQSKSTPVDTAAITNQASNLSINDESSRTTSQQDSPAFAENASIEQSTSENAEASPVDLISNDNTSNAAEKAQIDEPVAIEEPVASEQIETIPHPIKQQVVVEPTPIENEKVVADNEIKSSIKDYPQHQVEQQTYIPPVQAQPQVQVPQPPQQVQQVPQQVQQVQQQVQPTQQQQIPQQQQQQGYGQYHQIPYQAQMHHDSPQGLDDAASGPNDDLQNNQGASQQHGGYDSNMAHLSGYGMQSQGQQGYGQGAYGGANNSVKRKATRGRGKTNTYDSVNAPYFQDGPSPYMYPNTTGYNDASNLYPPNYYQPGTMAHNAIPSTTVGMNQMQQPPNQYMQHTTSQMPGMGSQQHIPFQQQAQPDSQSYFGAIGNQAQVGVTSQDSVYRQQPVYAQPSQQGNTQNIPQQPTTHSHYGMTPAQQQQQQQNSPYPYGYYPYAYPAPAPHYPTFQQQPMGMGMGVNQMGSMAPAGVKSPPPGYVQNPTSIPPSVPSQAYGYPHATYMPQNWAQYYTNQQYGMQLSPAQQQQQGPLPGNGNEPAPYGQQSSTWRPNQ